MKKDLKHYHYLGRKYNTFHFGENLSKNKKYGIVAAIFHTHAITKRRCIRYQNMHNLFELLPQKMVTFPLISFVLSLI